jgi:mannose-6-phosphate isomerase-like protein (cupin superfamily)
LKSWNLPSVSTRPHSPEILSSTEDARAILLEIPAGESLVDHQVHERAWVTVIEGQVEVSTAAGEQVDGGAGLLVEFAPAERHAVRAVTSARLLLLLTPWPGPGHPGAMSVEEKAHVRERAAQARGAGAD